MTMQMQHQSKTKLLTAAQNIIRAKGYTATTVDDICQEAGVTKGSFFHHFKSKDDLTIEAAKQWGKMTEGFFKEAPYHQYKDPLQRLIGYVNFRIAIMEGEIREYTCLFGTLVQETYDTHPKIRKICDSGMSTHIATLMKDIEEARNLYTPEAAWSIESLGYFIQSALQGAFIFAKAKKDAEIAKESLVHLRQYLELLFMKPKNQKE
ncbi:MAG: TetR/AcrR family transcriptional regulator [Alphaproteobacteria bacterium]|nr:TetR/AcrR family transcriptional regulator [Alphaproteobacteria bacterium]HPF45646.1 TetR/AcrR family transcriptional regulator [Emcibacteraceae bacterium]HRW28612.1 TetR/AcrR family transcriptional regulator [Emcibacteraceae bacterium]